MGAAPNIGHHADAAIAKQPSRRCPQVDTQPLTVLLVYRRAAGGVEGIDHLLTDPERVNPDTWTDAGGKPRRRHRQSLNRPVDDAGRQPPPAGMHGRHTTAVPVGDKNGQAVRDQHRAGLTGPVRPHPIGRGDIRIHRIRVDDPCAMDL